MAFGTVTLSAFLTAGSTYKTFEVAAGTAPIAIQLNPRETATLAFNVDAAGTTDGLDIQVLQGQKVPLSSPDLDGASSGSSLDLDTANDPIATDDDLNGTFLCMTSGDEAGECQLIIDSADTNDTVTLQTALSGTPSAGETYDRYRLGVVYEARLDVQTTITTAYQNAARVTVDGADGEWVLVRAKASGATDAHRVRVSYQVDGVSI